MAKPSRRRERRGNAARTGVQVRHARRCQSASGGRCSCVPSFQAQVWSPRDRKPIRKSFRELADAVAWRQEAQVALRRGTLRAPNPQTLREAAGEWLAAAEAGVIRTRSGEHRQEGTPPNLSALPAVSVCPEPRLGACGDRPSAKL